MLSNLKISTRLVVLLGALLVLSMVIGGAGLYAANKSDKSMAEVYNDRVVPLVQLSDIAERNLHNRMAVAEALIAPERIPDFLKEISANKVEIDKQQQAYMATYMTAEEKGLADAFVATRVRFVEEGLKPALAAMQAGNAEEIRRLNRDYVAPLGDKMDETLGALIQLQEHEVKRLYEEGMATSGSMRMLSISLILIGAIGGILLGVSIIRGVNRSVNELSGTMGKMASSGDLTARARVYGHDEIAQAATAFNGLIDGFANIIRQVNANATTVSSTAAELSSASLQISEGSQAQSEAAASTAAAVEEITVSINSVAANTEDVRKLADQSLEQTQQGNRNVGEMIGEIQRVQEAVNQIADSVKEFVDSTRAIAGMTQQVKDIAEQTNLLALNAAIEAARAGEQGRGFAVVADEVRKLAEKSAQSANEIDRVTNSLNQKSSHVEGTVQAGLRSLQATQEQVERVSTVLTKASEAVTQSSHGVSDIASSVAEQGLASTEIARNVEKIAQMSEENHAAVQSNSREIVRLEQLASDLQTAVGRFRV